MPEVTQESALKLLKPDTIFIMLGTNDAALRGTTAAGYLDNLVTMVTRIQTALPSARVIILSTLPTVSSDKLVNSYRPFLPALARILPRRIFRPLQLAWRRLEGAARQAAYVPREPHLNLIGGDMVGTELLQLAQTPTLHPRPRRKRPKKSPTPERTGPGLPSSRALAGRRWPDGSRCPQGHRHLEGVEQRKQCRCNSCRNTGRNS